MTLILFRLTVLFGILFTGSCKTKRIDNPALDSENYTVRDYFVNMYGDTVKRIMLTPDEWKNKLSPQAYHVLREKGTEKAFTGKYNNHKEEGFYTCHGCGQVLFSSKYKYDSGSGWPSFYEVPDSNAFVFDTDFDIGYPRREVMCGKCGGHLGHVFDDGPAPTGLRYCINSVSLDFIKTEYKK